MTREQLAHVLRAGELSDDRSRQRRWILDWLSRR